MKAPGLFMADPNRKGCPQGSPFPVGWVGGRTQDGNRTKKGTAPTTTTTSPQ